MHPSDTDAANAGHLADARSDDQGEIVIKCGDPDSTELHVLSPREQ